MVLGEFGGNEARHGRFPAEREGAPKGFAHGTEGGGGAEGKTPGDRRFAESGQEGIDPIPKAHGLAVSDKIRPAGDPRSVTQ